MNLANRITLLRIIMVPFFIYFMIYDDFYMRAAAFVVFSLASITDTIDGYLARKHGTITNFGKFMDPLADKLLVNAALISFVEIKELSIPAWMVIVIISREFIITGLRSLATAKNIVIPAALSGKFKTTFQMIAIVIILIIMCVNSAIIKFFYVSHFSYTILHLLRIVPFMLMFITTVLTLISGLSYIFKYKYLFFEK